MHIALRGDKTLIKIVHRDGNCWNEPDLKGGDWVAGLEIDQYEELNMRLRARTCRARRDQTDLVYNAARSIQCA
ncbi:hypothetical protein [Nitrosovibrio tenuis]|uniref:hypothetical protein n=1 Tax=Nitrosovibrio tenuis TaxID=1233 RepID=UPI000B87203A|nr:hypothetical protein [Nitrosovibrio tenuis]